MLQAAQKRGLSRKQKAFIEHYVQHPKGSATESAVQTYNVTSRGAAEQIAFDNLRNPKIISELAKYNNLVENTLVNAINDWGSSEKVSERSLAVDTAKFVHDKVNGKAVQQIETKSTKVIISIDLTQSEQQ